MSLAYTLMVYLSKVGRGQKEAGGGTRAEEWAGKWRWKGCTRRQGGSARTSL